MDVVIGLGSAGCKIADEFSKFPQYDVYKIDTNVSGENCFSLKQKNSPEEYERSVPDLTEFFKDIEGEILFVIGGGGKISGASLQILKHLRHNTINLLYVKPYLKSLSKMGALQYRATYGVLQEYTRSGIFNRMYIIDNVELEKIVGDVPILEYNKKLNELIVNAFHYINIFNHTDPVLQNTDSPTEIQKICTIGAYDIKNNTETAFYELQNIGNKCVYYAIPEDVLKSDGKLFKIIKEKAAEDQSSYKIYTTAHKESFAYFVAYSSFIQSVDTAS